MANAPVVSKRSKAKRIELSHKRRKNIIVRQSATKPVLKEGEKKLAPKYRTRMIKAKYKSKHNWL
jgi:hypothetical protein